MSEPSTTPAILLKSISKRFGAVEANKNICLEVKRGTIHGIVGENGAGKSTLMSILFGFYQADQGTISIHGVERKLKSPQDAISAGIGMVHQHFMLVENFTVLENIVLGAEGGFRLKAGLQHARATLEKLARDYDLSVPLDARVDELPVGEQQRVEILKALYRGADILILDEPTGALTPSEADHLFGILRHLKAQGKTILLITHKLREIMDITDHVSVMRRGEVVSTLQTELTSPETLAELMVGRRVLLRVEKAEAKPGAPILEVQNLCLIDDQGVERLKNISFTLHAGEILGVAGVAGNGQSELLEVLSGLRNWTSGTIKLNGEILSPSVDAAQKMRTRHVAHVPEDRHRRAMVMSFDASENAILGYHKSEAYGSGVFLNRAKVLEETKKKMDAFDVRPRDPYLRSNLFSGGNQQKLVLAREFDADPQLLLVGQPTRGVDIGAIEFIHQKLISLRDAGRAILLVSLELDEVRSLSDRVLVMFDGAIKGECAPTAHEREIGLMMTGVDLQEAA